MDVDVILDDFPLGFGSKYTIHSHTVSFEVFHAISSTITPILAHDDGRGVNAHDRSPLLSTCALQLLVAAA